jgi:hypothetical protein
MASGATQVEETTLSKNNDAVAIWELVAINLFFNIFNLDAWVAVQTSHVNLVVEVTDVSNNSVVLHLGHVSGHNNFVVASGSDKNVSSLDDRLEFLYFQSLHTCLQGTYWVTLSDDNASSAGFHGSGASFANITIAANYYLLAGNHDISGTHKAIWEGMTAAINIIELLFGDTIININGSEQEGSCSRHLVESENSSSGFFRNSNKSVGNLGPSIEMASLKTSLQDLQDQLELVIGC